MRSERTKTPSVPAQGSLLLALGAAILAAVWVVGLRTGSFLVHVVYPLGFWLMADGLLVLRSSRPLVNRPEVVARMVMLGAGLGLVLDFHMVHLTGILALTAVTSPALALTMYLGWGLSLPAVYSSYRLALHLCQRLGKDDGNRPLVAPPAIGGLLAVLGLPLAALGLFWHLWVGHLPGWFIIPIFAGFWLLGEWVQVRRQRPSLLGSFLALDPRPILAMVLASIPFTLLWEALAVRMGSWHYQNLFWMEPHLAGVPLVAFFGYLCGYYVLFLSVYGAVRPEGEETMPLYAATD